MDPNIPTQPAQNEIPTASPNLQQPGNENYQSKSKWKLILLILILLLIVGGAAFYFGTKQNAFLSQNQKITSTVIQVSPTPTPDPTANWKTYASKHNTYSIKYPSNWYIYEAKQDGSVWFVDVSNPESMLKNISLREHTYIMIGELLPNAFIFKDASSKSFSINSYTGIRRDQISSGSGDVIDFYNPNQGNNVELIKYLVDDNVFSQILSTFKFTDQNQSNNSNVKTYINNTLDIRFQYPSIWKIVEDSSQSVVLYPPPYDPNFPSDNINVYADSLPFLPQPSPGLGMLPYTSIIVNGVRGRQTQDDPKGLGRTGGCGNMYRIELPLKNETLILDSCTSLMSQFQEILKTLVLY